MKDTKFRILLDIHEVRSQATIPVKVGDVSCKIYITLVEGGKPYKIHENSFGVFTGKKGDDKHLFNNCVIENGIIRYDFTPQTVAAAGVLECEVRIYDEDGGVLTTPSFNIIVDERAVNDSELASSDEFSFLDEILVNEGQRIQNEKNRNEAFNNLGIDLEDDGEVISIVKTDIDGSQEKSTFLKYADVIPPVTASASGSAITIDSAKAPLQNLKLLGKTEQNGTPTPDAPVPLVSVGDSGSFEIGVYGANLFDGITERGHTTGTSVSNRARSKNLIPIIKGQKYTITKYDDTNNEIHFAINTSATLKAYPLNGGKLNECGNSSIWNYETTYSFTATQSGVMALLFQKSDDSAITPAEVEKYKFQVEIGEATPYEPYNKQTLTMPYTLRGTGEVKDEVDFARGVKTQNVIDVFENEFELTEHKNTNDDYLVVFVASTGVALNSTGLCSHLECIPLSDLGKKTGFSIFAMKNGLSPVHISVPKSVASDITSLKQWIIDNNVHLYYPLETPIETPLTETELNAYRHLMTNKGTTTILSEAEAEVDYYINKPNAQAIGNIHSQVNEDYFKLQQAIISLGGN